MAKKIILGFLLFSLFIPCPILKAVSSRPSLGVNDDQFVFISLPDKNKIQVYDSYGIYIKDAQSREKFSAIQKIVSCPCGGYLLIADSGKKEVIAIDDRSGEVKHRIRDVGSIGDISISIEKSRYEGIVNLSTNAIHLYNENGSLLRIIKGNNLFKQASSIHMNFQNHIYVADNVSQKLIELDIKGTYIRTLQGNDFSFNKILDLASDQKGNLYVLDEKKGLFKFSLNGKKMLNIPYPTEFKPLEIGVDGIESSLYLFSETALQKLSLDLKEKLKVQKPLLANKKSVIQLKIGSRVLTPVGFDTKIMDTAPFIDPASNRTFVPLRVISESFKASVFWDAKAQAVMIQKPGIVILLWIGSKTAKINGVSKILEAKPQIKDNRTFVPLRFIGEAFSTDIQWYSDKRLIRIISPFIE